MITAIVQSLLVVAMLAAYGVFAELRENALASLDERTQNKHQNLETQMTVNWSYLTGTDDNVLDIVTDTLFTQGKEFADIRTDADLNAKILEAAVPELLSRVRSNNTTGVFLILNGAGTSDEPDTYAGVYLRDSEPGEDEPDNSDIQVLRGPHEIFQNGELMPDSHWLPVFTFDGGADNPDNDFFYKPLNAALNGEITREAPSGYWAPSFPFNGDDYGEVITYTEPVLNRQGEVLGIVGVEISKTFVANMLGKGEFARTGRGCYFLGVTQDGGNTYRKVATGGNKYLRFFGDEADTLAPVAPPEGGRMEILSTVNGETMHAAVLTLNLYADDSPFAGMQWALVGMVDETTLFAFFNTIRNIIIVTALLAMALGVAVSMVTGHRIVRPIIRMANSLKTSDPNRELVLEHTHINEIDRLGDAITALNNDVIESATKLTKILKLAGLSVGVFEIRNEGDTAYCSDDVFTLLGREDIQSYNNRVPKAVCLDMVERAMANKVEESIYRLDDGQDERFVSIRRMQESTGVVGTILDVTADMENRRRLERERDYDLLTGILNRRAFEADANQLLNRESARPDISAMIMLDLDNLKFLNDTYGHDCGDGYIRAFADSLRLFGSDNALVARRSGDEFFVLLYGGGDKRRMRARIERAWEGILTRSYTLPDGAAYRMRASAGVAWYPSDARTLTQLIHYADYAMYKVKRSAKGTLGEFNAGDYEEDSFLVSGRNALDRMIDGQLIRFMAQPILSASTGETIGYELLLRSLVRELPGPGTVLKLANAEGKLPHIERLTWFKGLEAAKALLSDNPVIKNPLFFLNSIANQAINAEDERLVEEMYGPLLHRLVVEVTESERNDRECTDRKIRFVKSHGGKIAIDDYGTGYNSELALVKISADIVKLDMSFVRDVDTDVDKQTLIRNLISYARQRGIAVLAEGVETAAEMNTLIRFGVDYLQGYYFGHPQYQPEAVEERLVLEIRQAFETASAQDG